MSRIRYGLNERDNLYSFFRYDRMYNTNDSTWKPHMTDDEIFTIVEFEQNGLPGIASVNNCLKNLTGNRELKWHLSVLIQCSNVTNRGLPSKNEQKVLYEIEATLDPYIKADNGGVFLACVTHNALRELIWRVRNPEEANAAMQHIIQSRTTQRPLNYRIDDDPSWTRAAWYLDNIN